jgi:predicted dehydrogenase
LDWVQSGEKQGPSFEDGLRVQRLMEAVRRSNETRQWENVSIAQLVCG